MRTLLCITTLVSGLFLLTHCSKKQSSFKPSTNAGKLNYSDSIFYLKSTDYTVAPLNAGTGTYTVFPNNLKIDANTGKVTVSLNGTDGASQTGLWYKIKYTSNITNESDSTYFLISGITYLDKFYHLLQNDSMIYPVYNGSFSKALPVGNYDIQRDNSFAIDPATGQINILECLRRGFFKTGSTMGWKTVNIKYAINDQSNGAINSIEVVLYYYSTLDEVPSNVSNLMQAHQSMTLGLRTPFIPSTTGIIDTNLPSELSLSKPRPPCLVIIGH